MRKFLLLLVVIMTTMTSAWAANITDLNADAMHKLSKAAKWSGPEEYQDWDAIMGCTLTDANWKFEGTGTYTTGTFSAIAYPNYIQVSGSSAIITLTFTPKHPVFFSYLTLTYNTCTLSVDGQTMSNTWGGGGSWLFNKSNTLSADVQHTVVFTIPNGGSLSELYFYQVHSWESDWSYNSTHHWHKCSYVGTSCQLKDPDNISSMDSYAAHTYDESHTCTSCGYVLHATLDGTVVEANADLVLEDGKDLAIYNSLDVNSVSYTRSLSESEYKWGTICMPFAITSDANVQYYTLKSVEGDVMTFRPVTSVVANTPAVFQRLNDGNLSVSAGVTTLSPGYNPSSTATNWTLNGTFAMQTLDRASTIYYIAQDQFWCANQIEEGVQLTIPAYRAYFTGPAQSARSFNIAVVENGETTAIGRLENGSIVVPDGSKLFNLAGQRVNGNAKGILIINGKKIIK